MSVLHDPQRNIKRARRNGSRSGSSSKGSGSSGSGSSGASVSGSYEWTDLVPPGGSSGAPRQLVVAVDSSPDSVEACRWLLQNVHRPGEPC